MTVLTATEAKAGFLELVRNAREFGEIYKITRKGEESAVLMPPDVYEGFVETLDILRDKALLKDIEASLEDIKKGHLHSFEKAVGRKQSK